MPSKGLLAAVVVLAALGGAVYWSNKTAAKESTKPAADAPPKILTIADDQFKEIKLAKKDAPPTVLSKASGTWQITQHDGATTPMAADQDAAGGVVSSLANLTSDRLIDDKPSSLASYGLQTPSEEIVITKKDGKTDTLLLGDDSPTASGTYAKLANDPRVFTIASFVKTGLDKTAKDLRDKRLLTFNSDKLTGVAITAKGQTVEFGKNGQNEWQIVKPKPMRADGSQVDELVRKLKDAKMDTSVSSEDAKKAQTAFASGARVATVATSDAGGTQTLEIRKDKDKTYYAKSSAVEGIYKSTAELGDSLDKSADDFRNKKLFDFGFTDPTKVEVGSASYQKSGDKWMSGASQMDSASAQNVIDKLRDLAATKFVDKSAGDPFLVVSVTSGDGKRLEKINIAKQGDNYFATRDGEASVYQLDAKAVDDLQKAAASVKPYTPPKTPAKK
ncbi:MAG: hypothetical protein JWO80_1099 [Bryobacterales bacterium]|nr:hypothetical protein [Bryobacterales bacterium]